VKEELVTCEYRIVADDRVARPLRRVRVTSTMGDFALNSTLFPQIYERESVHFHSSRRYTKFHILNTLHLTQDPIGYS
jgi:hypothetical protein